MLGKLPDFLVSCLPTLNHKKWILVKFMNHSNTKVSCLTFQSYYLVGIKGVGMASLAAVLIDMGKQIQGWDVTDSFVTQPMLDRLRVQISDQTELPDNIDAVIFTAAHHDVQHPLVQQAVQKGLPIFSLAEVTGALSELKPTIAVCGVGGKSTTSAMLAWVFDQITHQASYMVGVGEIKGLRKTGAWQDDGWFVVEADEYASNPTAIQKGQPAQPRFLSINPTIIICTQILHDHPDVYPSIKDTLNTFEKFFLRLPNQGILITNADDLNSQTVVARVSQTRPDIKIIRLGEQSTADVQISSLQLELSIPGQMNLRNAAATLMAATQAGLPNNQVFLALRSFQSTSRRLEKITERDGLIFYDDYAHHPQEISAAIEALRSWYPDLPLTIIFQPHTYSRTKSLLSEFAQSLAQADQVILLPIFASAREQTDPTTSSQQVVDLINQLGTSAQLATSIQEAADQVGHIKQGLVVTMGAGDVYLVHDCLKCNT